MEKRNDGAAVIGTRMWDEELYNLVDDSTWLWDNGSHYEATKTFVFQGRGSIPLGAGVMRGMSNGCPGNGGESGE